MKTGKIFKTLHRHIKTNGKECFVELTATPLLDENNKSYIKEE